jgi:hypothetical protein
MFSLPWLGKHQAQRLQAEPGGIAQLFQPAQCVSPEAAKKYSESGLLFGK